MHQVNCSAGGDGCVLIAVYFKIQILCSCKSIIVFIINNRNDDRVSYTTKYLFLFLSCTCNVQFCPVPTQEIRGITFNHVNTSNNRFQQEEMRQVNNRAQQLQIREENKTLKNLYVYPSGHDGVVDSAEVPTFN